MGVENWSTDPAQNAIQGNVVFSENMKPAKVNDSMRQVMADIAAWRNTLVTSTALTTTLQSYATVTQVTTLTDGLSTEISALQARIAELESFRTGLMAGSQASMDTFLEAYNEFQATGDAIAALNNLIGTKANSDHNHFADHHTKTEAAALFLGKTAKAADSNKLDGKSSYEYLLQSSDYTINLRLGKYQYIRDYDDGDNAGTGWICYMRDGTWVVATTSSSETANIELDGHIVWHAGNDGPGSGLNAELLDDKHASEFALAADIDTNFVKDARLGSQVSVPVTSDGNGGNIWQASEGSVLTSVRQIQSGGLIFSMKPVQKKINDTWVTVAG